jgi:hypothetical protein
LSACWYAGRRGPTFGARRVAAAGLQLVEPRARIKPLPSQLWEFCNAAEIFSPGHIGTLILCSDVARLQHRCDTWGRANMSIETVLLIVILTFGLGFVLNRWDLGRSRFRRGSLRGGVWGRRRV